MGRKGSATGTIRMNRALAFAAVILFPAYSAYPAQVPFEQTTRELASPDTSTRIRAAQMLKEAGYPEAAVPLATLVTDPVDEIQLEAIAAELNIFLAERIVPRKRVGFVVEVRNKVLAESAFSSGPLAIGARPVPLEVLTALRAAWRDDNPRVAVEALYAFGVLGVEPAGSTRRALLRESGPHLASLIGTADPAIRFAAVRVIGRIFAKRAQDEPIEEAVGDALIVALNDPDRAIKIEAMQALGSLRYERAVHALTELFQFYGKGETAEAALDAVARIAHSGTGPLFTSQLTAKNLAFRAIGIEGLSRLGDASQVGVVQTTVAAERSDSLALTGMFASSMLSAAPLAPIVEALTRPKLRDQAWGYLVELAAIRSPMFTPHLQDPDARIRVDIIDALGLGGDSAALPLVERALTDPDAQVAKAAERAVARLRASQQKPLS